MVAVKPQPNRGIFRRRHANTSKKGWRSGAPAAPFTPIEGGCPVRVLEGDELDYWKGVYEAREREAAQRRTMFA